MKEKITLFPGMAGVTRDLINQMKKEGVELFSVDIMVSQKCNFKCTYCYAEGGPEKKDQLTMTETKRIVKECLELGVRVLNMQGGEPFLWHPADWKGKPKEAIFYLMEYIKEFYGKNNTPISIVSFTDVAVITKTMAKKLIELGIPLCCKLDSLDESIQDQLLGIRGGFKKMMLGFQYLIDVGYGVKDKPPLSTNTVVTRLNYATVVDVFRWSRQHGFKPFIIPVHVHGRAKELDQFIISEKSCGSNLGPQDIKKLFEELANIDAKEFQIYWKPESPWIENRACSRHLGGVHIRSDGMILPCSEAPDAWILGNIRKNSLKDIVTSEKVKRFRDIYNQIHEDSKCSPKNCPLSAAHKCYGCRTRAYDESGFNTQGQFDHKLLDPQAFFAGDPACWRKK